MTLISSGTSRGYRTQLNPGLKNLASSVMAFTLTSASFCAPTAHPWSTRLADDHNSPRVSFKEVTAEGKSAGNTSENKGQPSSEKSGTVSGLRLVSGLTADQLARLFGVSRRSIQKWVAGGTMAAAHQERLAHLYAVVLASGDSPEERRKRLLSSLEGMSRFHQLIAELKQDQILEPAAISAREAIGV